MKIPEEQIQKIISMYKPDYRVLTSANYEFPKVTGKLDLSKLPSYDNLGVDYLTIFGVQLSVIQLSYVLFDQVIINNNLKNLISYEEFEKGKWTLFKHVIHKLNLEFKKKTSTKEIFMGEVEVKDFKGIKIRLDFDLNNGHCIGNLETIILK